MKSGYTDDTARTRVGADGDESDGEKTKFAGGADVDADAELGYYRAVQRRSDSDTEGASSPRTLARRTLASDGDPRATLVGSPPFPSKDLGYAYDYSQSLSMPRPIAEYPPSPTLASPPLNHSRIPSAEAGVAVPLLAHTRSESSYYGAPASPPPLPSFARDRERESERERERENEGPMAGVGAGRVPLGMGHAGARARVGSVDEAYGGGPRRVSAGSVNRMSRVPSGGWDGREGREGSPRHPLSISSLPPPPEMPLLNLGVPDVGMGATPGSSSSNVTTTGHA